MSNPAPRFSTRTITPEQCKDTGMAMVLLLLLVYLPLRAEALLPAAVLALLLNMVVPQAYRSVAVVWLGFSHMLGSVMSRFILGGIFFLVLTPMGLARRLMGKDSLRLKEFKAGKQSVMVVREHTFTGADLEKPY